LKHFYKYCTSEVYEKYISKGIFRLGTLSYYREQYENGSGYADKEEGILDEFVQGDYFSGQNTLLNDSILRAAGVSNCAIIGARKSAINIRSESDFHILSFSLSYSAHRHNMWRERTNCNYDVAVDINPPLFKKALLNCLNLIWGELGYEGLQLFHGDFVQYFKKNQIVNNVGFELNKTELANKIVFVKDSIFANEDEFRLVIFMPKLFGNRISPVNIGLGSSEPFIKRVIRI